MSKIKINLDRPGISSEEISKRMNFEDILVHQKIMAKPFYKTAWFYGVSGLATVSLIAGSIYSLNQEGDKLTANNLTTESVPILDHEEVQIEMQEEPIETSHTELSIKEELPIEETNTLKETTNQEPIQSIEEPILTEKEEVVQENVITESKTFSFIDLYPRISGRLNGGITKQELLNDEGLVTNSDVKIISFQLHLVDGTGGKVYESKGNVLNSEMKSAITQINVGEEIYFEKIDGQGAGGEIVRLSPLRYVLLN